MHVLQDVRRLYKHSESSFKVTLIEASSILASFDQKLRKYAEKKLSERPNFTLLKSSVIGKEINIFIYSFCFFKMYVIFSVHKLYIFHIKCILYKD